MRPLPAGIIVAVTVAARTLAAQTDLVTRCDTVTMTLAPAYVHQDSAGSTAAAKFVLEKGTTRAKLGGAFPVQTSYCASLRGTAAWRAAANPDDIKALVSARGLIALARDDPPPPPNPARPFDPPPPRTGFDFGFLSLGGSLTAQSNQQGTEALVAGGGVLVYTHNQMGGFWLVAPHVQVTFSGSRSVRSKLRDSVGASSELEGLWDLTAEWYLPIDKLSIVPRVRYFDKEWVSQQVRDVETTSGAHVSVTVAYPASFWIVQSLFVEWSKGPLPVKSDRTHAVLIGIVTGK